MSRDTENFSIYSLMSIRTIASSSSNKYFRQGARKLGFADAVVPRKMKEPIGFLSSCRPARLRRIASATAFTASS